MFKAAQIVFLACGAMLACVAAYQYPTLAMLALFIGILVGMAHLKRG